jgi:hypothetical protein
MTLPNAKTPKQEPRPLSLVDLINAKPTAPSPLFL